MKLKRNRGVGCSAWLGDMVGFIEDSTSTKEDIQVHCSDEGLQRFSEQLSGCSGLAPSPRLVDRSGRVLRYNGWSAGAVEEMNPNTYSGQHTL